MIRVVKEHEQEMLRRARQEALLDREAILMLEERLRLLSDGYIFPRNALRGQDQPDDKEG